MKKRLFDFSIASAITTLLAYAMLLFLFLYTWITGGNPWIFGTVFFLLILSLLFVLWYFVIMSPVITKNQLKHGHKVISKKKLRYKVYYDRRFKEMKIRLRDSDVDYRYLDKKKLKKREIVIQATEQNLAKLSMWLECEITVPEEEKNRKAKLFKKRKQ